MDLTQLYQELIKGLASFTLGNAIMSLVPIIQPPLMRLLTTKAERRIRMEYTPKEVSHKARVLFPIVVTITIGLLVPAATLDQHANVGKLAS